MSVTLYKEYNVEVLLERYLTDTRQSVDIGQP